MNDKLGKFRNDLVGNINARNVKCGDSYSFEKFNQNVKMHVVPADRLTVVENPAIHAYWLDHEYPDGIIETKCSNCGWTYPSVAGWRSYYCPNCGAVMKEKNDDNTAQNAKH